MRISRMFVVAGLTGLAAGCGEPARLSVEEASGVRPRLVEPAKSLLPTVDVAEAVGWPAGAAPSAAPGLRVNAFASGLDHPRTLLPLANGDVLVAEASSPGTDPGPPGIKGVFFRLFLKKAGSAVASPNRIILLRDADGDGTAEQRSVLRSGLYSPFGMAAVGGQLFVANADSLVAFPFAPGQAAITASPRRITGLPAGRNHHWTKALAASPDGRRLYVGVGSNSNIGENGLDEEQGRAAIWEVDPASGARRIFASGIRNPTAMAFNGATLWTVANERDELGGDLVPDYLTSVRPGGFYGWPWSYWGGHVDTRVKPARPDMVARAIAPDYALGPHVAALGLAFSGGAKLPFGEGAYVGLHGSWNRKPPSGYKVVFVPFSGGKPTGLPVDVLTGFRSGDKAFGRPVGVAVAKDGSLLVADDVGGRVWRVSASR